MGVGGLSASSVSLNSLLELLHLGSCSVKIFCNRDIEPTMVFGCMLESEEGEQSQAMACLEYKVEKVRARRRVCAQ